MFLPKRLLPGLICLCTLAGLIGCGGKKVDTSLEMTFKAVQKAVQAGDWGAAYDHFSPASREEIEDGIERQRRDPDSGTFKDIGGKLGIAPEELREMTAAELFAALMKKSAGPSAPTMKMIGKGKFLSAEQEGVEGIVRLDVDGQAAKLFFIRVNDRWYLDMLQRPEREKETQPASVSNERAIVGAMHGLVSAWFQARSRDGGDESGTWVKDIATLYRMRDDDGKPLVHRSLAQADKTPARGESKEAGEAAPHKGYWFSALTHYTDGGKKRTYAESGISSVAFGFVAFPAEYGTSGKLTYVVNESGVVYSKDTGGKSLQCFPDVIDESWDRAE